MRRALRAVRRLIAGAALLTVLAGCAGPEAPPAVPSPAPPTAQPARPDPRIGALFIGDDVHVCTGAVLAASADVILTAAHCVAEGVDTTFVPGYTEEEDAGDAGRWRVDAVYLDPRWVTDQDPAADFAVVRVSRDDGARLDTVVGSGFRLGTAPGPGREFTVTGYPAGVGGGPVACAAATAGAREGFPELHCDGVVAGFSGAPWVSGSTVSGLVGGLDGGGCVEETSYSPPFGAALDLLLSRAEAGGPGDTPPDSFDDGCN